MASPTFPDRPGILAAVGNTPLIELKTLSKLTGCRIMGKCEFMNPGGSVKDRAALWMVEEAERTGLLTEGGTIFEGTGGNTGIGLAMVAAAKGYKSCFSMSASLTKEKQLAMAQYGAEVVLCTGGFKTPGHYFHEAARRAAETKGGFWANQFDNEANFRSHVESTGPEIWQQLDGKVDGFICSVGTGGTIAGMSHFLKEKNPACTTAIVDCEGSCLRDFVRSDGALPDVTNINGYNTRLYPMSPGDSIAEGIGINRLTQNFLRSKIDIATQGTNREVVDMAYYLLTNEGVHVGPSAALNVVGAVKLARHLGPGHTIVTVLCDGGSKYLSKLFDAEYLIKKNLPVNPDIRTAEDLVIGPWDWYTPKENPNLAPTRADAAAVATPA